VSTNGHALDDPESIRERIAHQVETLSKVVALSAPSVLLLSEIVELLNQVTELIAAEQRGRSDGA
jgi:hypothetical protein